MVYHLQNSWDSSQPYAYNSMTVPQTDQQEAAISPFSLDNGSQDWIASLEVALRGRSHPDSQQEWTTAAHAMEPKAFAMQNHHQQQYSYPEAHHQPAYPPHLHTSSITYGAPAPSSSFGSNTQWAAPSPGASDSHNSSALSPTSDRDFRHDLSIASSPFAALPLTRSHSGISALSHETAAADALSHETAAAEFSFGGGAHLGPPYQQQTTSMALIHPEMEEEPMQFGEEEMFMDHEGEQEGNSITVIRAANSQYLSPAPQINRVVSPAPSAYSSHSHSHSHSHPHSLAPSHNAQQQHNTQLEDDTDVDAPFDDDIVPADDTDTDSTYTPNR
ncbi:hypothetical protein V495_03485, partial [Pseudogymnoascus sp. VKM F-4514 (FW-929)]